MVETSVGGVVIADYDGDGDGDLLLVDGGVLPGYRGEPPKTRLLRNDTAGGGRPAFVDVTDAAGLGAFSGYGCGGAAGDYDGDGDLDLYVANYVDFALDNNIDCGDKSKGIPGYCHPDVFRPLPDRFYRNRGGAAPTFEDATAAAGLARAPGAGLGVAVGDLDDDGWPDLYVANDLTPNHLLRNKGDGTFEDLSLLSGTAYSPQGRPEAGMGVALGDADGDGRQDLVVTNFELETNALYRNAGGGVFLDHRFAAGLAEPSMHKLAFGVAFADLDHDGDLDLVVANGHINPTAAELGSISPYRQANQVFENSGDGRFRERPDAGLEVVRASRGLALGDLDLDGDLDLAVVNVNDRAEVYENVGAAAGWLDLRLRAGGANPYAIGARLRLTAGGRDQLREVRTGSSYLSQNDLPVHFGLGSAKTVDALQVTWPDGDRRSYRGLPAGGRLVLVR